MIESQPMPSIAETTVEMIEWVFPEHAGGPGQIHGGRMMEWITRGGHAGRFPRGARHGRSSAPWTISTSSIR